MKVVAEFLRKRNALTLDIDVYKIKNWQNWNNVLQVQELLFNLLHMFGHVYIRESSSGKGLHIVVNVEEVEELRIMYDDPKRYELDGIRGMFGNMNRFLWFKKGKKKAGNWVLLESEEDIVKFVEGFFGLRW